MSINLNDNNRGGTFCLSKAGLAIGSTASQIAIAAPNGAGVDYCIKGISYHKADAATAAITAADTQAVLTTCLYVICLDSSGTVSRVKGREVLNADLTAGTDVLEWPEVDEDVCPIGAVKVKCESTATFTAGTTLFSAANITDTYYNLVTIPSAPLTA
jgi:hypothetical protein